TRARNCTIVVMQPKTVQILALAQYPGFNPAGPQSLAATTDIPVANVFQPGSNGKAITVANSSNVGRVQVVQHVSPEVQYQMFRAFGLGEPTGLDLPGESQGILPVP